MSIGCLLLRPTSYLSLLQFLILVRQSHSVFHCSR